MKIIGYTTIKTGIRDIEERVGHRYLSLHKHINTHIQPQEDQFLQAKEEPIIDWLPCKTSKVPMHLAQRHNHVKKKKNVQNGLIFRKWIKSLFM